MKSCVSPLILSLALGLPLAAHGQGGSAAQSLPKTQTPLPSVLDQREIRAQLSPRRYTTLAAEIGAKVQRLPVVEGGAFRQGQLLVQFDCSLPQAQLNKAQAGWWMPPRRPGRPTSAWPS